MLTKEELEKLRKEFIANKKNIVLQRMLYKVPLIDLIRDKETEFDSDFNISIKTHGVLDQNDSARCWSFAGLNLLREIVINKCNLSDFELSGSYIAFYDRLERFNKKLDKIIEYKREGKGLYDMYVSNILRSGMSDAGWPTNQFGELVNKYGVVPKNVFPETYQSSNTYETNIILARLIRKFYIEIEKCNDEDINNIKDKYFRYAYKIVSSVYGIPSEKFNFEYTDKNGNYRIDRDLTPKTFYEKYIGIDILNDYVELGSYRDEKYKYNNIYEFEDTSQISGTDNFRIMNVKPEEMKELVLKQLKDGELVRFCCSTTYKRIDGVWVDIYERFGDLFDIDLTMNSNDLLKTNGRTGEHCMLFTGVKTIDDKPVKWKIENSWGSNSGVNGDYIATDDWFDKYVFSVIINKKYLNKNQKKVLKKEPVMIKKWDAKLD